MDQKLLRDTHEFLMPNAPLTLKSAQNIPCFLFLFKMVSHPYSVEITKTLVVDFIPHQPPALMGTATVSPCDLIFDFSVERLPGRTEETVELKPNFDTNVYFIPDMLTELIINSIKSYYHDFLSSLK